MKIKMPLSKSEQVLALLNQWDPAGKYEKSNDWRAYRYEAETIAQNIKSNNALSTIERVIREAMDVVMDGQELNEEEVKKIAECIQLILKRK